MSLFIASGKFKMSVSLDAHSILIVDDTPTNLEVLSRTLSDEGFQVSIAIDGEDALEQVNYRAPELILLDVMMPGVDGFEVCRRLKADLKTRDIPVIFMTALSDAQSKVKGFSMGAVDYVTKPFHREEVLARVRVHLQLQNLAQTLEDQNKLLKHEIKRRKAVENNLIELNQKLEERVEKRTQALQKAIEKSNLANRAKNKFLANMSHELRTPLNGILGYTQILERSPHLGQRDQKGVKVINQCGTYLLTLINDILDISKIEAQKLELNPTSANLASVLECVVEICKIRVDPNRVNFEVNLAQDLPEQVWVDEKRLRQVLLNLIGNAIKFTDSGTVTFKVSRERVDLQGQNISSSPSKICGLKFEIIDSGIGISSQNINKLFNAFEQVSDPARQARGTGLGLAISQCIIEMMDSKIHVSSELGVGSHFFFALNLPIVESVAPCQIPDIPLITGYKGSRKKILLIDEQRENEPVLFRLLKPLGFEVEIVESSKLGLSNLWESKPDLVILDLAMPVVDGFELLKTIRCNPRLESVKVLIYSVCLAEGDRAKSLEAGGDDFLSKPLESERLLQLLKEHLDLSWTYTSKSYIQEDNILQKGNEEKVQDIIPPSQDILQNLLTLVQQGRLKRLMTEMQTLSKEDSVHESFLNSVTVRAQRFQVEQLEIMLTNYLEASIQ